MIKAAKSCRTRNSRRRSPHLLACLTLAACGGPKPTPVALIGSPIATESVALGNGYGLNLPRTVSGFTRVAVTDGQQGTRRQGTDIVASYARTVPPEPIDATIRVRKVGEPGSLALIEGTVTAATPNRSQAALDASINDIRHSHPDARVLGTGPALLVRFGAMQDGRAATLSLTDTINGVSQPVDLRLETFCCADDRWSYEFRFAYPASLAGAADPIAMFLDGIAWSPQPAGSIDKPE